MPSSLTILFLALFVLAVCLPGQGVYAFGAGNIPSFAYLEGRAFRHGDIEDVLAELAKGGGGMLGAIVGKSKFGGLDIKRVYFGNWLRDYSQAVDIASLKKLPLQTIINLCMVLGFLAHGYATNEFEVTPERLACYLPTEHIDNPKGYGEGEDARKYDPRLRGPVDPRELEIDLQTGMKNYIANESGSWDTSKAVVRRTITRCIELGRAAKRGLSRSDEKANLYESYRLLGQAMHTLEDFTAHSNWCELVLVNMGHRDIFLHVGDAVRIQARNGNMVAPLVTGTFGSSDFIHSLLGEATDHISEASVSDLNRELDKAHQRARSGPGQGGDNDFSVSLIKDLLMKIPDTSDSGMSSQEMQRGMDDCERIRAGAAPEAAGKTPEQMSPQELHAVLWRVLTFRDRIVKKIEKTIEKIPGLGALIEKVMDSISVFIFTTLEPYIKPLLKTATTGLNAASGEVIDNHDQYEVFNDPRASDPTHSFLSKDHFNLILNEPAGRVAKVIVAFSVERIVKAWNDTKINVHEVTEDILQCLFHPDFHDTGSKVQREMLQAMHEWVRGLGHKQHEVLSRLTKEQVRNHSNIRGKGDGGASSAEGSAAYNAGLNTQSQLSGYINNAVSGIPGVSQAQNLFGKVNDFTSRPSSQQPQAQQAHSGYGQGGAYGQGSSPRPSGGPFGMPNVFSGGFGGGGYGRRELAEGAGEQSGPSYVGPPSTSFPPAPSMPSIPGTGMGEASGHYDGQRSDNSHHQHGHYPSQDNSSGFAPPPGPPPSGFDGYNPSYGGPPSFPSGPGQQGPGGFSFPDANSFAPPSGPPPPGGGFYGPSSGAPPGWQPTPGPPPGWR